MVTIELMQAALKNQDDRPNTRYSGWSLGRWLHDAGERNGGKESPWEFCSRGKQDLYECAAIEFTRQVLAMNREELKLAGLR